MKHGSNNMVLDNNESLKPEVGMGVTVVSWTDRHPYTVIHVSENGKTIEIQEDKEIGIDMFEPNPEGITYKATMRKDGQWKIKGDQKVVLLGVREKYNG